MAERLTITAYSTALYSTWIFLEDFRLLLDAGDGVTAHLLGKSRKVHRAAISHADRDHITGLFQLQQLNAHAQPLEVLYPADSGSFPAMAEFCTRFDPWSGPNVRWTPVGAESSIEIGKNLRLVPVINSHIPSGDLVKSVGYKIVRDSRKLRAEHAGKASRELAAIRDAGGEDALTYAAEEVLLAYSGDTGVCEPATWESSQILIHEATFLAAEDREQGRERRQQHSVLRDVLEMAAAAAPEVLVLNHFSARYSEEEIRLAISARCGEMALPFRVQFIPPGCVVPDVLGAEPAWAGK